MGEPWRERKYVRYLQTISIISILTSIVELILFCFFNPSKTNIQLFLAVGSLMLLSFIACVGLLISGKLYIYEPINRFFNRQNKSSAVTILFFIHMTCVAVYVIQDGGVQASSVSNILLLDASFGYFFAEQKRIKHLVSILCLLYYVIGYLFYFDKSTGVFQICLTWDFLPALITVLSVMGINLIINDQIATVKTTKQKRRSDISG